MENPYLSSELPIESNPKGSATYAVFWFCITVILIVGLCSIIGRQWGMMNDYGKFGGYGHFPLVWIGGFAVYPGYLVGLFSFGGGDWMLCLAVALFTLTYYLTTIVWAFRRRNKNAIQILAFSYLISLGLNCINFIFVGLLHI